MTVQIRNPVVPMIDFCEQTSLNEMNLNGAGQSLEKGRSEHCFMHQTDRKKVRSRPFKQNIACLLKQINRKINGPGTGINGYGTQSLVVLEWENFP
jgi:hypothetical protein